MIARTGRELGGAPAMIRVFVTARDEQAVKVLEMRAVDYLVKPGEPGRLEAAVERARAHTRIRRRDPFPREMATVAPEGPSGAKRAGLESVCQGSRVTAWSTSSGSRRSSRTTRGQQWPS